MLIIKIQKTAYICYQERLFQSCWRNRLTILKNYKYVQKNLQEKSELFLVRNVILSKQLHGYYCIWDYRKSFNLKQYGYHDDSMRHHCQSISRCLLGASYVHLVSYAHSSCGLSGPTYSFMQALNTQCDASNSCVP